MLVVSSGGVWFDDGGEGVRWWCVCVCVRVVVVVVVAIGSGCCFMIFERW